jgi:ATP-dependent RNA helicase DeaD
MQVECFADLQLSRDVLRGVEELGFSSPSPIQAQSIGPLLDGRDVIGQAQTGTGKTAAFGIPMIERLDPESRKVQGLIMAPTRELAVQIADHLNGLCKYTTLKVLPVYGGESIAKQIRELRGGVQIVVGTPGRILDHLARGTLSLSSVKVVVLDEADRMLDMGFINDIEKILSKTPRDKQMSLFSATIDESVMSICDRYMRRPQKILVSKDEVALTQIDQFYVSVEPDDKFDALCKIIEAQQVEKAIIFCKTQRGAARLAKMLRGENYDAKPLHGGLTQPQRDNVIESFRRGRLRLLVATDVAARGLDIQGVSHIFNHNIPMDHIAYFHRIGRTARMEAEGTAISLVSEGERDDFRLIRNMTKTRIVELPGVYAPSKEEKGPRPVCSDCGKECSVPFKPTEGRPVYCSKCYQKHRPSRRPSLRYMRTVRR